MKTINFFSKVYGLLIRILFLLLVFIIGCTKQDIALESFNGNLNELNLKSLVIQEGPIALQGITGFGFYAAKKQRVLADPYINTCDCTAELTFSDKQNFVLHTKEYYFGMMYREVSFNGKMTPSGELTFSYPMTFTEFDFELNDYVVKTVGILPEMKLHTGCVFYGQGINNNTLDYKGYFDGNRLFADMHIIGLQEEPGQLDFLSGILDGPIMLNYLIDVEIISD